MTAQVCALCAQCGSGEAPAGFVKLRVGGKVFETSIDVLLSEPDSIFTSFLQGEWAQQCGEAHSKGGGAIESRRQMVFDRDPKRFRVVLNWLRTRELVCEGGVTAEGIKSEAEFFGFKSLEEEATRVIERREGHRLLQAAVDSRYVCPAMCVYSSLSHQHASLRIAPHFYVPPCMHTLKCNMSIWYISTDEGSS